MTFSFCKHCHTTIWQFDRDGSWYESGTRKQDCADSPTGKHQKASA